MKPASKKKYITLKVLIAQQLRRMERKLRAQHKRRSEASTRAWKVRRQAIEKGFDFTPVSKTARKGYKARKNK